MTISNRGSGAVQEMGAITNIVPSVTIHPEGAFQKFETEGEPYVRYKFQGRLYDREWAALAAMWLRSKEQARSQAQRSRRLKLRIGWLVGVALAATGAAIYLSQASSPLALLS